jgi:hypothetical protein
VQTGPEGNSPPAVTAAYPVRLDGRIEAPLSRWLWLFKWFLLIPHWIVLTILWFIVWILTIVAGISILFTGVYPRGLFDFNVGVLRWTWRVMFYGYNALGTDRYPPFALHADPSYPADLEVDYPERLSRGLVLVKWWLLAIPQYLVVGVFLGGMSSQGWFDQSGWMVTLGLVPLLVLFVGFALLFADRYPMSIFDFVMGLNRWAVRVVAYAGLMRDEYPPFRLDPGGTDPGHRIAASPQAGVPEP